MRTNLEDLMKNMVATIVDAAARRRRSRPAEAELGMTLIEIMVVLAIIVLVMGGVSLGVFKYWKSSQVNVAKKEIMVIQNALTAFAIHHRNKTCPEELDTLYKEGHITKKPKDPWGQPFTYKCPGDNDTEGADICSSGPDRKSGSEDDICSYDMDDEDDEGME